MTHSAQLESMLFRAVPAVLAAGRHAQAEAAALAWHGSDLDVRSKDDPTDFVTRVDEELERRLVTFLEREFPGTGILAEEGSRHGIGRDEVWVLDPLDGTRNYIRQHPGYCVSLGLVRAGRPVLGIILDITAGELYTAVRGGGAFRNGQPLRVAAGTETSMALVGVGLPAPALADAENVSRYLKLMRETAALRQGGSVARELAFVAAGSLDAFWQPYLAPWDVAAGIVIVEEAGGRVELTDNGNWLRCDSLGAFAASAAMFSPLRQLLMEDS